MNPIEKYKKYRKIGTELNHKIIHACVDRDIIMWSAKLLGIFRGDALVLDNEDEVNVVMEFAMYDYRVKNQNLVEIYREKKGWENEIEKELLDGMVRSNTSLFKITSVSKEESTLLLSDVLNKKEDIKLTDIAFSTKSKSDSIKRYVSFFKLNKIYGIEVRYR